MKTFPSGENFDFKHLILLFHPGDLLHSIRLKLLEAILYFKFINAYFYSYLLYIVLFNTRVILSFGTNTSNIYAKLIQLIITNN